MIRSILLVFALTLITNTQAFSQEGVSPEELCPTYIPMVETIREKLPNFKGQIAAEIIEVVSQVAYEANLDIAENVRILVMQQPGDKDSYVFKIKGTDEIWSAVGGSEFQVSVDKSSGNSFVELIDCWDSGE